MHKQTQIFRLGSSAYSSSNFTKRESTQLQELGVNYITDPSMISNDTPLILITNSASDITKSQLTNHPLLLGIIHPNSGYDNYTIDLVNKLSCDVFVGNQIRAHAVTNYTLSSLMTLTSPLPLSKTWDKKRIWNRKSLNDMKIQLIGFGVIGNLIYNSIKHLVTHIYIYDPFQKKNDLFFDKSDIVIIAASLNCSSFHLVNKEAFDLLHSEAIIINPARGAIIDTNSLITFLKNNPKAKAILDVFEQEPFSPEIFKEIQNIYTTSHIAGVYNDIDKDIINFVFNITNDLIKYNKTELNIRYDKIILKNRIIDGVLI